MFICSIHGSTVKFFGIVAISVVTLSLLLVLVPQKESYADSSSADNAVASDISASDNISSIDVSDDAAAEKALSVSYEKIKTNEDRIALLKSFGWEVDPTPIEEADITIPAEFDRVMESYNAIQRGQGFDLSKYRNRDMKRYTYLITNYAENSGTDYTGTVYANLLIYKNRVVAADICSSDVNGFIAGLNVNE
ncbi:MAG: DUF4830 domain-containing protein [Firmicutes bacterium]|nr:DUF4830 domain-containing protein [Bacillota bacterium]